MSQGDGNGEGGGDWAAGFDVVERSMGVRWAITYPGLTVIIGFDGSKYT